jgi:sporulation protein YlmC with PRC-barrel domain
MKIKSGLTALVIAATCGTLQAADQQTTPANPSSTPSHWQNNPMGKMERADKIIGREVKDSQDQKLGRVKDFAIDLQNGRIVEVIVGTGGLVGVDERYVAVPPGAFMCDPASKGLQLNNVDKDKLAQAPSFQLSEWDANVTQPTVTEVYHYYGAAPYFGVEVQTEEGKHPTEKTYQLGNVVRTDKLMGSTVHNVQDERLGKVDDLIVDLPAGRVAEVVLASGGFLGLGDELSAVPPQAFRQGTEPDTIVLDTSKDALTSAPHFKSSEWPDFNNPEYVTSVYRAYNVEPYYNADNTAQNTTDRSGNSLTPMNQGTSQSDIETTREIRKEIMAADGLSVNARNVKVITVDGKVTLRGTVNTGDEKRIIDDIAAKVATRVNVDDQLMVENSSRTSSIQ